MTLRDSNNSELPPLYACHDCRLIGPEVTAIGHELVTGHKSARVADEIAAAIRDVWVSEGRSPIDGAEQ